MVKDTVSSREPALKKPRKKTTSTGDANKPEEDAYKKIVNFEEGESSKRSADKDAQLYFQTCKDIRQLLVEISALKEENTPEAKAKIDEKRISVCMLVALLKKLNRLEKFRTKAGRDKLHQEKLQTDSTKLQLQNLLYELSYLKKEIYKCFQFRSLDEEIDLIPEEEFFKNAPETISCPNKTKTDNHQLQLARLNWELQQRKQLASQCRKLESDKEKVAAQIVSKQERLEKLAPQLNHILEVTKPLQEQLGMQPDQVRQEHQKAHLLPNPLYLLYAKVDAYSQVYDKNIIVHILGDEEEAKQLKKDDTESQSQVSTVNSEESDQEDLSEEMIERQKRHHRKSSRIVDSKDLKKAKLLASHPLHVQIKIVVEKDKNATLILNFYYRLKLHVVTVKCQVETPTPINGISTGEVLSAESILLDLFPNDSGKESPNPTNHYQLQQLELGSFSSLLEQLGYPYVWAQRICGLEFISAQPSKSAPLPSSDLCQTSVESVMKVLNKRFRSRISLAMQVQELEKNIIPAVPDTFNVSLKLSSSVSSWQRISWQEYCECPSTEKLIAEEFVNSWDILYRAVIIRKTAKLVAYVVIKNNFPDQRSIFNVVVHWNGVYHSNNCDNIRDMERAVNTDWPPETKHVHNTMLLSAQIRRLVSCFDIYLEVVSPEEFKQDKIYFNPTRGRNRRHPYKYLNVGGGVYTQY